ncbi:uncharacterized protein LOC118434074 [Folsomia candida]|uniref:Uncharacterized protein n=1 Tax=Folsomia candida TaxID=158441 RepID=A0A226F5Z1_FOLCA|nr:uncharacterized protein LOC118434074 [Folsomia candida]OXA65199.1 hypothetical protein Fcan01_01964 [Folsomia candida]
MNKESLLSDAKLSAINYQGTENVKMYNNKNNDHLDSRVHGSSSANILNQVNHESQVFRAPPDHNHCNIHGMWISSVAGVAIELLPIVHEKGRVEIKTRIFELQNTLVKGILTSKWTGNGVIYPDSPTTMTIVFQEHMNEIENHHGYTAQGDINSHSEQNSTFQDLKNQHPKTAVFVGQCLVCQNTPVLKGTWTVLLHAQSCANQTSNEGPSLNGVEINSNDTLHLLEKSPP